MEDKQHTGEKKKNKGTNTTHKTKDRVTRTLLKTGGDLMCFARVSSSCSTSGTHSVTLFTNQVISHKWGKDQKVFTTRDLQKIFRYLDVLSSWPCDEFLLLCKILVFLCSALQTIILSSFGHCISCCSSIYDFWLPFGIFRFCLDNFFFKSNTNYLVN